MSEILSLAQKFKTQSEKQAKTIEQEVQNATTQLNSFMTAKLQESESIIKEGMTNLDTSNEQLLTMLATHQTDMNTALTNYLSNIQAHLIHDLSESKKQTETLIENYTDRIDDLIRDRENRIEQIIKSEMKSWVIVSGIVAIIILVLGILLGALIVKKFSKPTYLIQQSPINYGQK